MSTKQKATGEKRSHPWQLKVMDRQTPGAAGERWENSPYHMSAGCLFEQLLKAAALGIPDGRKGSDWQGNIPKIVKLVNVKLGWSHSPARPHSLVMLPWLEDFCGCSISAHISRYCQNKPHLLEVSEEQKAILYFCFSTSGIFSFFGFGAGMCALIDVWRWEANLSGLTSVLPPCFETRPCLSCFPGLVLKPPAAPPISVSSPLSAGALGAQVSARKSQVLCEFGGSNLSY